MVLDVVDHWLGAGDEAAQRGEGLAEGAHHQVYVVVDTQVSARPFAAAQDADGVGVIHHQPGAVFLAQGDDLRQRGDVASHAEHAIHHDQLASIRREAGKHTVQVLHVVVAVALHRPKGQAAAIHDAGMVVLVGDHVIAPSHQG